MKNIFSVTIKKETWNSIQKKVIHSHFFKYARNKENQVEVVVEFENAEELKTIFDLFYSAGYEIAKAYYSVWAA